MTTLTPVTALERLFRRIAIAVACFSVVEALTARIEMLEAMIRQSGRMTPGQAMGEE